jgi:arylsulfatase
MIRQLLPIFIFAGIPAILPASAKPNVLLILADDLGFSDLSCYGGEIPTPQLDRLATGGAKFSSFYTSARCCPSRASLITGLHPHQAGIGSFTHSKQPPGKGLAYKGALLPTCATLAEMLLDDGYSTWMVGKWHMAAPGPIHRGFQNYYGYKNFLAHSENQWDPDHYVRLPESAKPELSVKEDFYVTDVFSDYSLEFLKQARAKKEGKKKPWFLYLAHSSPHFPIQAPKASIDRHLETYRKGWDVLRAERFQRQKKLGLIPTDSTLPPLSEVPVDRDDIANGFSGKPNPAWDSLPADRREDLARRMATFAAMVEHVDQGIGRILADLEKNGELDNTIIAFLSDNGACYEWGPFGFDGRSRLGQTTLHTGEDLAKIGQPGTHSSYGSGWANLGNTPLNMYKHFCHEGGISSPLILHWPDGIEPVKGYLETPSHLMDIVPTILAATGAKYPAERDGHKITPVEGTSLLPALTNNKAIPQRVLAFEHQDARGLRKGDWKLVWGKRQPDQITWELYNLAQDRSEQNNVAQNYSVIKDQLVKDWNTWAKRVHAEPFIKPEPGFKKKTSFKSPQIDNRPLTLHATVQAAEPDGVVLAQGGKQHGYALHFIKGIPTLDVRVKGKVTRLSAQEKVTGKITLLAKITAKQLTLTVNGKTVTATPPGLIPVQPQDPLSIGQDDRTSAGDYEAPNAFNGKVLTHKIGGGAFQTPK